ncbi:FMN-binding negative transcriptional regulator [Ideonella sp.]|uniref:FMN-binding negative transcriptional regulator n=1 Tax=Ideonella sp. TaxID=1929293 RepID=UPI003BB7C46B
MYLPTHFVQADQAELTSLITAHPLALLMHLGGDGTPEADPVPLHWRPSETGGQGGTLIGHVARANPLWRAAAGQSVLAVFQGPQAYISPNWYPSKQSEGGKVVPTWNYSVVQARGVLRLVEEPAELLKILHTLTDQHESRQAHPWSVDDAPAGYIAALQKAIVGFRIEVSELVGKWKVSQNRPEADRQGVTAGLASASDTSAQAMARLVAGRPS